jgi:hypothetical protein
MNDGSTQINISYLFFPKSVAPSASSTASLAAISSVRLTDFAIFPP